MRKLKLFLCLWILLEVLAGYGFLPVPGARAQGVPPGITYVTTAQNWSQTSTTALTGCPTGINCTTQTLTLTPCPSGVDTTTGLYDVYISDTNPQAVAVTGGTCTSGASSGTITFIPYFSHFSYTIGSASSGIQETINAACGMSATAWKNSQCSVTIPGNGGPSNSSYVPLGDHPLNNYYVYGTIFLHSNQSLLSGYGVSLNCLGRGACLQVGSWGNAGDFSDNTVEGLSFRAPTDFSSNSAYAGVNITNVAFTSGYATITTATAHNFRPGDMVTIMFTDSSSYWGDAVVTDCGSGSSAATCTSSSTTFRYVHGGGPPTMATPGVVALAYSAILDNGEASHFKDIQYDLGGEHGSFNNFFDMWDDENATIEHFNNNAIPLNHSANWMGSFVFSGGQMNVTGVNLAPVITLRDSNITANWASCVTDYNSNGLYLENDVCQASGLWQVYSANQTGNYQGADIRNIYSESSVSMNPLSPAHTPFPGLGIAGLIAGASSGSASFQISGTGGMQGGFPSGGSGSTSYSYFIVVNDCPAADWTGSTCTSYKTQTSPLQILTWNSTGSDSIPVRWPRVANGTDIVWYDVLRMTVPTGAGNITGPYAGGCPGGSGGTCGSVATAISQSTACSGALVCSYTDTGSSTTSAYTVNSGTYVGQLSFWPGNIVSVASTIHEDSEQINVVGLGLQGAPLAVTNYCSAFGASSPGAYTSCLTSKMGGVLPPNQSATLMTDGGPSLQTNTKGRLNFLFQGYVQPHQFITLVDSQPALTTATSGYRPPASANDTWIGTDVTGPYTPLSAATLAFGAPVSITNYIGTLGTGSGWLERLSASLKEFNVPAKFDQSISVSHLIISANAPTISSGFGTSPSVVHNNGTAVFTVNVGTGGTASSGVIGLPTAANGWAVHCDDVTTQSTSVFITKQTASSTTSATITQYSDAAVATAWGANDILVCQAAAY